MPQYANPRKTPSPPAKKPVAPPAGKPMSPAEKLMDKTITGGKLGAIKKALSKPKPKK